VSSGSSSTGSWRASGAEDRDAGIADQEIVVDAQAPGRRHDAGADIAEAVLVIGGGHRRVETDLMRRGEIGKRAGMMLKTSSIGVGCGHSKTIS
jgi:hypothetical protein